jgi:hypothetical protein
VVDLDRNALPAIEVGDPTVTDLAGLPSFRKSAITLFVGTDWRSTATSKITAPSGTESVIRSSDATSSPLTAPRPRRHSHTMLCVTRSTRSPSYCTVIRELSFGAVIRLVPDAW